MRTEVNRPVAADGGRGDDLTLAWVLPLQRSIRIQRVKVLVPRAEVNRPVLPQRRRRIHPAPGLELPLFLAVCVECVELPVVVAEIDCAIGANSRGRLDIKSGA